MEMKIHQNIMNNKHLLIALGLLLACNHATYAQKGKSKEAKTTFQTAEPWKPETDVRADATMVYGTLDKPGVTFEQRIQSWRDKGYLTEFITGVAWGDYKDYFLGKWDGVDGHLKEGQRDRNGNEIAHGHLIPYIVPTESFIRYMQETQIKRVIDAGITSIYLEEPEFWMRGGYSEAFHSEWQKYYNFPWRPQHESPENRNAKQIGVEDVLQFMDENFDPEKDSHLKLLYIESIQNPDRLLYHASSLIRKGCKIAAIKAGSSESGSRAASSHTGAIASSDSAVEALFRKAGIVRCFSREELTTVGCVFTLPELKGKNFAIITHAGGPGVMLTDALSIL